MAYEAIPPVSSGDSGTVSTVSGAAVQDVTISSLTGDTDGDYIINGVVVSDAANRTYTLWINGADAVSARGVRDDATLGVAGPTFAAETAITLSGVLAASQTAAVTLHFAGTISVKNGIVCGWTFSSNWYDGTRSGITRTKGEYTPSAQCTSIGIHGSAAGSIVATSYIRLQKTGFTA